MLQNMLHKLWHGRKVTFNLNFSSETVNIPWKKYLALIAGIIRSLQLFLADNSRVSLILSFAAFPIREHTSLSSVM